MGEAILGGHRQSFDLVVRNNNGDPMARIVAGSEPGSIIINRTATGVGMNPNNTGTTTSYTNTNTARNTIVAGVGNMADTKQASSICRCYAGACFVTGMNNEVHGNAAFASGFGNIANSFQAVVGKFSKDNNTIYDESITGGDLFIVGCGTSADSRANAFKVDGYGKVYYASASSNGADYAEYFEWQDKNPNDEDRRGLFVTLDGEKIRIANSSDQYILGVISGNPSVVGDSKEEDWQGRWLTDIYGSIVTEDVIIEEEMDENGSIIVEGGVHTQRATNPDYNPNEVYIPRSERSEWDPVGLLGKLVVRDDGTCEVGKFCKPNDEGIATFSSTPGYYVMSRLDESHVRIIVK